MFQKTLDGKSWLVYIFWRLFPFLAATFVFGWLLLYAEDDPTYWFMFVPIVMLNTFTFFVSASYASLATYRKKQLNITDGARLSDPQLRKYEVNSSRWVKVTMLSWICTFLIGATIVMISIKIQRGEWSITEFSQPTVLSAGSQTHTLLNIIDIALQCLFTLPIFALVLAAIYIIRSFMKKRGQEKATWNVLLFISIASFIISTLLIFVLGWTMESIVRKEVKNFITKVPADVIVKINGQQIKDSSDVIHELSRVAPLPAHHSHDTQRVRIDIISHDNCLTLEVGRDSQYDYEYWIFYPSLRHLKVNEIGKIRTSLFDGYFQ